jgi:AcrR family transcriptional regulator
MNPDPNTRAQRSTQIIKAATTFAAKDFDRATMDDIAVKTVINKAAIYPYTNSKNVLIYSLFHELLNRT